MQPNEQTDLIADLQAVLDQHQRKVTALDQHQRQAFYKSNPEVIMAFLEGGDDL